MIEVVIDSIRVSLMSQERIVVLKDTNSEKYLPIWIGPCEADAITYELQEQPSKRPLTHDLLKTAIREMGGRVVQILINDLRKDIFYARILIDLGDRQVEIDSRPSDAIALAVRVKVPIFVEDNVMREAAITKEADIENEIPTAREESEPDTGRLSAFADFVDSLDLDDLEDSDD
jgi:bifunctional DNase/RNase